MHIPDGFINAPTSLAAGAVAAGGVGVSLRRAAQTLQERQAPLAGLVAAYIFAVQMLNFPVAAGTSGHLLGGALAAVLVGPWAGALCVAVVLLVQGLLFADGGYAVFLLLRRAMPATRTSVTVAAGIAAGISVVLASLAFVVEYAIGGSGGASVGTVFAAMVGVHTLIGIGEGIITALTVGVVLGVRPDLVYGAADLQAPLVLGPKPAETARKAS